MSHAFRVSPLERYDGPDFDEFCIAEKGYLSARRDRAACASCELSNLCQAGFEEQVRRVVAGQDPSLTKDCQIAAEELTSEKLFHGLNDAQIAFLKRHVPGLDQETDQTGRPT